MKLIIVIISPELFLTCSLPLNISLKNQHFIFTLQVQSSVKLRKKISSAVWGYA